MLLKEKKRFDYYAFGMEMPGRKWQASNYRYSHNGQEKEQELFDGANSAEYWMYDSRIGRRWERDPIFEESWSPYATFADNPILFSDAAGTTTNNPNGGGDKGGGNKAEGNKAQTDYLKEHPEYKSDGNGGVVRGNDPSSNSNNSGSSSGGNSNSKGGSTNRGNSSNNKTSGGNTNGNSQKTTQHKDNHKVDAHGPKDNPLHSAAAANTKVNGRPDHFAWFGHSSSDGFQYTLNGKTSRGYSATEFDRMMRAYSKDWERMRKTKQHITITLYGCNMASHSYITHEGIKVTSDITIAQKISMLQNVTVIAANGYVHVGLTMGKPAVQGISNYKDVGSWIKIEKGKETILGNYNYGPLPGFKP